VSIRYLMPGCGNYSLRPGEEDKLACETTAIRSEVGENLQWQRQKRVSPLRRSRWDCERLRSRWRWGSGGVVGGLRQ